MFFVDSYLNNRAGPNEQESGQAGMSLPPKHEAKHTQQTQQQKPMHKPLRILS